MGERRAHFLRFLSIARLVWAVAGLQAHIERYFFGPGNNSTSFSLITPTYCILVSVTATKDSK